MDPAGKIALVTGGAQGIGLAITKELLRHGVKGVAVCDVNVAKGEASEKGLQQEYGKGKVVFIKTDVTNEAELEDAFKRTIKHFGGLDIVVNNAGLCNDNKWQSSVSVNVVGALQCAVLALKYLGKDQEGKGGVLINTGSVAGLGDGADVTPMYNATKHVLVGFSRPFRSEFLTQTTGVRVMVVCPGFTSTEIISELTSEAISCVTLREEWMPEFHRELAEKFPVPQRAESVGETVLHMIREGNPGSVWVSEHNLPAYEINIPRHEDLKV